MTAQKLTPIQSVLSTGISTSVSFKLFKQNLKVKLLSQYKEQIQTHTHFAIIIIPLRCVCVF